MNDGSAESHRDPSDGTAVHLREARQRARQVFSGEGHLSSADDWRRALIGARDLVVMLWLIWVALQGFGGPTVGGSLLVALTVGLSLLHGIAAGRATLVQLRHYESELQRERAEIRDNIEQEREEVRALYAAKGFAGDLLEQVVDIISEDDDRLLKVMMEEELGLSMHHMNHPLIVGLWNFGAALAAGLALSLPPLWLTGQGAALWMPVGGAILLAVIAFVVTGAVIEGALEFFTVGLLMALITGGVVYFLSQWLAGFGLTPIPTISVP